MQMSVIWPIGEKHVKNDLPQCRDIWSEYLQFPRESPQMILLTSDLLSAVTIGSKIPPDINLAYWKVELSAHAC